jgi:uncharacterized membrane protein YeaQ/YmgE (transglycosylase-associated protein family)
MNDLGGTLVVIIVPGVVSGWLAARVRGQGFGVVGDLFVGVCGAFIGNWLLPRLGVLPAEIVAHIIDASMGAVILLIMVRFVLDDRGWGTGRR